MVSFHNVNDLDYFNQLFGNLLFLDKFDILKFFGNEPKLYNKEYLQRSEHFGSRHTASYPNTDPKLSRPDYNHYRSSHPDSHMYSSFHISFWLPCLSSSILIFVLTFALKKYFPLLAKMFPYTQRLVVDTDGINSETDRCSVSISNRRNKRRSERKRTRPMTGNASSQTSSHDTKSRSELTSRKIYEVGEKHDNSNKRPPNSANKSRRVYQEAGGLQINNCIRKRKIEHCTFSTGESVDSRRGGNMDDFDSLTYLEGYKDKSNQIINKQMGDNPVQEIESNYQEFIRNNQEKQNQGFNPPQLSGVPVDEAANDLLKGNFSAIREKYTSSMEENSQTWTHDGTSVQKSEYGKAEQKPPTGKPPVQPRPKPVLKQCPDKRKCFNKRFAPQKRGHDNGNKSIASRRHSIQNNSSFQNQEPFVVEVSMSQSYESRNEPKMRKLGDMCRNSGYTEFTNSHIAKPSRSKTTLFKPPNRPCSPRPGSTSPIVITDNTGVFTDDYHVNFPKNTQKGGMSAPFVKRSPELPNYSASESSMNRKRNQDKFVLDFDPRITCRGKSYNHNPTFNKFCENKFLHNLQYCLQNEHTDVYQNKEKLSTPRYFRNIQSELPIDFNIWTHTPKIQTRRNKSGEKKTMFPARKQSVDRHFENFIFAQLNGESTNTSTELLVNEDELNLMRQSHNINQTMPERIILSPKPFFFGKESMQNRLNDLGVMRRKKAKDSNKFKPYHIPPRMQKREKKKETSKIKYDQVDAFKFTQKLRKMYQTKFIAGIDNEINKANFLQPNLLNPCNKLKLNKKLSPGKNVPFFFNEAPVYNSQKDLIKHPTPRLLVQRPRMSKLSLFSKQSRKPEIDALVFTENERTTPSPISPDIKKLLIKNDKIKNLQYQTHRRRESNDSKEEQTIISFEQWINQNKGKRENLDSKSNSLKNSSIRGLDSMNEMDSDRKIRSLSDSTLGMVSNVSFGTSPIQAMLQRGRESRNKKNLKPSSFKEYTKIPQKKCRKEHRNFLNNELRDWSSRICMVESLESETSRNTDENMRSLLKDKKKLSKYINAYNKSVSPNLKDLRKDALRESLSEIKENDLECTSLDEPHRIITQSDSSSHKNFGDSSEKSQLQTQKKCFCEQDYMPVVKPMKKSKKLFKGNVFLTKESKASKLIETVNKLKEKSETKQTKKEMPTKRKLDDILMQKTFATSPQTTSFPSTFGGNKSVQSVYIETPNSDLVKSNWEKNHKNTEHDSSDDRASVKSNYKIKPLNVVYKTKKKNYHKSGMKAPELETIPSSPNSSQTTNDKDDGLTIDSPRSGFFTNIPKNIFLSLNQTSASEEKNSTDQKDHKTSSNSKTKLNKSPERAETTGPDYSSRATPSPKTRASNSTKLRFFKTKTWERRLQLNDSKSPTIQEVPTSETVSPCNATETPQQLVSTNTQNGSRKLRRKSRIPRISNRIQRALAVTVADNKVDEPVTNNTVDKECHLKKPSLYYKPEKMVRNDEKNTERKTSKLKKLAKYRRMTIAKAKNVLSTKKLDGFIAPNSKSTEEIQKQSFSNSRNNLTSKVQPKSPQSIPNNSSISIQNKSPQSIQNTCVANIAYKPPQSTKDKSSPSTLQKSPLSIQKSSTPSIPNNSQIEQTSPKWPVNALTSPDNGSIKDSIVPLFKTEDRHSDDLNIINNGQNPTLVNIQNKKLNISPKITDKAKQVLREKPGYLNLTTSYKRKKKSPNKVEKNNKDPSKNTKRSPGAFAFTDEKKGAQLKYTDNKREAFKERYENLKIKQKLSQPGLKGLSPKNISESFEKPSPKTNSEKDLISKSNEKKNYGINCLDFTKILSDLKDKKSDNIAETIVNFLESITKQKSKKQLSRKTLQHEDLPINSNVVYKKPLKALKEKALSKQNENTENRRLRNSKDNKYLQAKSFGKIDRTSEKRFSVSPIESKKNSENNEEEDERHSYRSGSDRQELDKTHTMSGSNCSLDKTWSNEDSKENCIIPRAKHDNGNIIEGIELGVISKYVRRLSEDTTTSSYLPRALPKKIGRRTVSSSSNYEESTEMNKKGKNPTNIKTFSQKTSLSLLSFRKRQKFDLKEKKYQDQKNRRSKNRRKLESKTQTLIGPEDTSKTSDALSPRVSSKENLSFQKCPSKFNQQHQPDPRNQLHLSTSRSKGQMFNDLMKETDGPTGINQEKLKIESTKNNPIDQKHHLKVKRNIPNFFSDSKKEKPPHHSQSSRSDSASPHIQDIYNQSKNLLLFDKAKNKANSLEILSSLSVPNVSSKEQPSFPQQRAQNSEDKSRATNSTLYNDLDDIIFGPLRPKNNCDLHSGISEKPPIKELQKSENIRSKLVTEVNDMKIFELGTDKSDSGNEMHKSETSLVKQSESVHKLEKTISHSFVETMNAKTIEQKNNQTQNETKYAEVKKRFNSSAKSRSPVRATRIKSIKAIQNTSPGIANTDSKQSSSAEVRVSWMTNSGNNEDTEGNSGEKCLPTKNEPKKEEKIDDSLQQSKKLLDKKILYPRKFFFQGKKEFPTQEKSELVKRNDEGKGNVKKDQIINQYMAKNISAFEKVSKEEKIDRKKGNKQIIDLEKYETMRETDKQTRFYKVMTHKQETQSRSPSPTKKKPRSQIAPYKNERDRKEEVNDKVKNQKIKRPPRVASTQYVTSALQHHKKIKEAKAEKKTEALKVADVDKTTVLEFVQFSSTQSPETSKGEKNPFTRKHLNTPENHQADGVTRTFLKDFSKDLSSASKCSSKRPDTRRSNPSFSSHKKSKILGLKRSNTVSSETRYGLKGMKNNNKRISSISDTSGKETTSSFHGGNIKPNLFALLGEFSDDTQNTTSENLELSTTYGLLSEQNTNEMLSNNISNTNHNGFNDILDQIRKDEEERSSLSFSSGFRNINSFNNCRNNQSDAACSSCQISDDNGKKIQIENCLEPNSENEKNNSYRTDTQGMLEHENSENSFSLFTFSAGSETYQKRNRWVHKQVNKNGRTKRFKNVSRRTVSSRKRKYECLKHRSCDTSPKLISLNETQARGELCTSVSNHWLPVNEQGKQKVIYQHGFLMNYQSTHPRMDSSDNNYEEGYSTRNDNGERNLIVSENFTQNEMENTRENEQVVPENSICLAQGRQLRDTRRKTVGNNRNRFTRRAIRRLARNNSGSSSTDNSNRITTDSSQSYHDSRRIQDVPALSMQPEQLSNRRESERYQMNAVSNTQRSHLAIPLHRRLSEAAEQGYSNSEITWIPIARSLTDDSIYESNIQDDHKILAKQLSTVLMERHDNSRQINVPSTSSLRTEILSYMSNNDNNFDVYPQTLAGTLNTDPFPESETATAQTNRTNSTQDGTTTEIRDLNTADLISRQHSHGINLEPVHLPQNMVRQLVRMFETQLNFNLPNTHLR